MSTQPATKYPNNVRTVSGLNVRVFPDDVSLNCNTSGGAVSIDLNELPANSWNTLYKLYIFDGSANAGTNNITIIAPAGYKINNAATLVLNVNGSGAMIRIGNNTNYLATLDYSVVTNAAYQKDEVLVASQPILDFQTGDGLDLSVTNDIPGTRVKAKYSISDTGWLTLNGFAFMSAGLRPQYRIIGKSIHFRGSIVIPLDNGGVVLPYTSEADYWSFIGVTPFTGAGGVTLGGAGNNESMLFNNGSPALQSASHYPDATYSTPFYIAIRRLRFQDDANKGALYTSFMSIAITSGGVLVLGTVFDAENFLNNNTPPIGWKSSMLRFTSSNIIAGQDVLDYTIINSSAGVVNTLQGAQNPPSQDNNIVIKNPADHQHAVTMDATLATEIGGFSINASQLKAYKA